MDVVFASGSRAFRLLLQAGNFLLLAQKKVTKENGLPRSKLTGCVGRDGIFRQDIRVLSKNGARPVRRPPGLHVPSILAGKPQGGYR